MKFKLTLAYRNLQEYIAQGGGEEVWIKTMVEPYWGMLMQGAPFSMDHLKPVCNMELETAKRQLEILNSIDWERYSEEFETICEKLPKEDDDVMQIVIYPSVTNLPEGIYGTGVWGNIILNINAINETAETWIPFVFAHEYHHGVWGDYWYCKQGGRGLDDTFLEKLIIEGEADAFAGSLYPELHPSWQQGVSQEEVDEVWGKLSAVLNQSLTPEEYSDYMFGNREKKIPQNAGYYYAIRIIQAYEKNVGIESFSHMVETAPIEIYEKSQFYLGK